MRVTQVRRGGEATGTLLAVLVSVGCGEATPLAADRDAAPSADAAPADVAGDHATGATAPLSDLGLDADAGPGKIGGACEPTSSCEAGGSGTPMCRGAWPGGYCLVEACGRHSHDCPGDPGRTGIFGDSLCVFDLDGIEVCLRMCHANADCRPGYVCDTRKDTAGHGLFWVCVPKDRCVRCMKEL